jgi:hypothetical protein
MDGFTVESGAFVMKSVSVPYCSRQNLSFLLILYELILILERDRMTLNKHSLANPLDRGKGDRKISPVCPDPEVG